jgi:hypothetical protein
MHTLSGENDKETLAWAQEFWCNSQAEEIKAGGEDPTCRKVET